MHVTGVAIPINAACNIYFIFFNFSSFPYQQKTCKFILEIFFNLQNRKLIYLNTCSEAKIYRNPKGGHFIIEEGLA